MKKISVLNLLFILFASLCFAEISVDKEIPNRIYVGEDKNTDWIDVERTGKIDYKGNFILEFEDLSPIKEIWLLDGYYWIVKSFSVWKLYQTDELVKQWILYHSKNTIISDIFFEMKSAGAVLVYTNY